MTRSPRTAVFTSSKEAEYASVSLSSSSGGGERERAITFGEKTCASSPAPGSQSQHPQTQYSCRQAASPLLLKRGDALYAHEGPFRYHDTF